MPLDGKSLPPVAAALVGAKELLTESVWFNPHQNRPWKSGETHCAATAIEAMTEDDEETRFAAFKALMRVTSGAGIEPWNDRSGRTLEEVRDAFDRAIIRTLNA